MFFILSKTISLVFMPLSLIFICIIFHFFAKRPKVKKMLLMTGLWLLFLFGNDFISNETMLAWEVPPTPFNQINKKYEIGVVLSGITTFGKSPHDRVYFSRGADRLMHAIQLYKMGKVKKLLISGGNGSFFNTKMKEADKLAEVAIIAGVPETDIIIENQSRNTRENAAFSKPFIEKHSASKNILLITSAFHMKRASACFTKVGIKHDVFGTDYYSHDRKFDLQEIIIPSAGAFQKWNILFKEGIGLTAYKVMGYI